MASQTKIGRELEQLRALVTPMRKELRKLQQENEKMRTLLLKVRRVTIVNAVKLEIDECLAERQEPGISPRPSSTDASSPQGSARRA